MRPSLLAKTLEALWAVNENVHIEGSPGCGKTSVIKQTAHKMYGTRGYIPFCASTKLVEDGGIPDALSQSPVFGYKMPDWFPAHYRTDIPEEGVVNIDELSSAEAPVQKLMAHMIQERELHGVRMKEGWRTVSTGNRKSDKAGANNMLTHLVDRLVVIQYDVHIDDFMVFCGEAGVCPEIPAFVKMKPDLLDAFDPNKKVSPTCRSWAEGVDRAMKSNLPKEALHEVIAGRVGEGAAADFTSFLALMDELPDRDSIIRNPMDADIPKSIGIKFALAASLSYAANDKTFENIIKYVSRWDERDVAAVAVMYATKRDKTLYSTPAFINWASKNSDIFVG